MKKLLFLVSALVSLLLYSSVTHADEAFDPHAFREWDGERAFRLDEAHPNISKTVKVFSSWAPHAYTLRGSGFFIKGGYVVTNYHVIAAADPNEPIYVADGTNHQYIKASVVHMSPNVDLVLLKTDAVEHPYFELANNMHVGDYVQLIGSSTSIEHDYKVQEGTVDSLSEFVWARAKDGSYESREYRTKVSARAYMGYSGGPGIDKDGKIVGVTATTDPGKGYQAGLVRLDHLRQFLDSFDPASLIRHAVKVEVVKTAS